MEHSDVHQKHNAPFVFIHKQVNEMKKELQHIKAKWEVFEEEITSSFDATY